MVLVMTTIQKGEIARLKIQLRAVELGYNLSIPTTECRYDAILDIENKLSRVQIKYAGSEDKRISGSVKLSLEKTHKNNKLVYSSSEVDLLLVYIPKVDKIIQLSPDKFDGKKTIYIRYAKSRNGCKDVHFVDDLLW